MHEQDLHLTLHFMETECHVAQVELTLLSLNWLWILDPVSSPRVLGAQACITCLDLLSLFL